MIRYQIKLLSSPNFITQSSTVSVYCNRGGGAFSSMELMGFKFAIWWHIYSSVYDSMIDLDDLWT